MNHISPTVVPATASPLGHYCLFPRAVVSLVLHYRVLISILPLSVTIPVPSDQVLGIALTLACYCLMLSALAITFVLITYLPVVSSSGRLDLLPHCSAAYDPCCSLGNTCV